MAIANMGDDSVIRKALDDWYFSPNSDYVEFAQKYPMNGELEKQRESLAAMRDWCDKMEVKFTPTFFVDGYQLPDVYTINDVNFLLKD